MSVRTIFRRRRRDDCSATDAIIGVSTHTPAQVEAALREPITYLAVGPVFATRTKDTGYQAVGLEFVSAVARMAGSVPVVAIGGITLENASSVIAAGAAAVAVIGDLVAVARRARPDARLPSSARSTSRIVAERPSPETPALLEN